MLKIRQGNSMCVVTVLLAIDFNKTFKVELHDLETENWVGVVYIPKTRTNTKPITEKEVKLIEKKINEADNLKEIL